MAKLFLELDIKKSLASIAEGETLAIDLKEVNKEATTIRVSAWQMGKVMHTNFICNHNKETNIMYVTNVGKRNNKE